MEAFVGEALRTADLPAAMKLHEVGWGDYTRARRDDPAFEVACQEIDQVIRHALLIQLECRAAQGDYKAAKLLSGGLAEIRKALQGQGVELERKGPPRDFYRSGSIGKDRYPLGPCMQCISGLVVKMPHAEVIVRNDDARYYRVEAPKPQGYSGCEVVYGKHRDPGRIVADPDASGRPDPDEGGE